MSNSIFLTLVVLACSTTGVAQRVRYFKAEHGVGATYLRLGSDRHYTVIDREHMGVFLTDEGQWQQNGGVIKFLPKKKNTSSYEARENKYKGRVFLAITSAEAAAGIVIPTDEIEKGLDADPQYLPDHVLFKINKNTYTNETKQNYPFRYIKPVLNK